MTLPKFDYFAPTSIEDTLALLANLGDTARVMAGGTDLVIKMRNGSIRPKAVIGLKKLQDFDRISFDRRGGLTIGAGALLRDVAAHPDIRRHFPALACSAAATANVQIRNMGTLAGNLCNAAPSADNAPPLLAMGAEVTIAGPGGMRRVPLDRFFVGPGRTVLGSTELLTAIQAPPPAAHSGSAYHYISARSKVDIAAACVGVMVRMDGDACLEARVALGAVAPTPMRARKAERLLTGRALTPAVVQEAGLQAARETRPISDLRASAQYRRKMVEVLTQRAVAEACRRAG